MLEGFGSELPISVGQLKVKTCRRDVDSRIIVVRGTCLINSTMQSMSSANRAATAQPALPAPTTISKGLRKVLNLKTVSETKSIEE